MSGVLLKNDPCIECWGERGLVEVVCVRVMIKVQYKSVHHLNHTTHTHTLKASSRRRLVEVSLSLTDR